MISSTFHEPQVASLQKQSRLVGTRMSLQHQHQHQQHQHQQHEQPHQQFINDSHNIPIIENSALLPRSTSANNINYLQQQPIICSNLSSPSQLHQQQGPTHHSHSLMATMNNTHVPSISGTSSNTIFDSRIGRLYSAGPNSTSDYIDNGLSGMSNLPNTILINNFTQQLQPESSQHLYQQPYQHHIAANLQLHSNSSAAHQHQHQHNQHHQQQQQQNQTNSIQQQQFFPQQHMSTAASGTSSQTMQLHLPTTQSFYVSSDSFDTGTNAKIPAYMPPMVNAGLPANLNDVHPHSHTHAHAHAHAQQQLPISTRTPPTSTNSPVVLDRINICINNHYSDSGMMPSAIANTTPTAVMPEGTPPLPSPIIPPIQHSGAIDPVLLIDSLANNNEITLNTSTTSTPILPVISEPDSTTTSNTPPTTPENANPILSIIQSPSTSSSASDSLYIVEDEISATEISNEIKTNENEITHQTPAVTEPYTKDIPMENTSNERQSLTSTPVLQCTLDLQTNLVSSEVVYSIGEDVFVKKEDDRLYLGTIIDSRYQRYRVRFDDKSEVWCSSREVRKFGNFGDTSTSPGEISNDDGSDLGTLCISCKVRDLNGVEICERCGRGYHHKCTTETIPGSNDWLCKRCNKPMKLDPSEVADEERTLSRGLQLPYDINSLTWDAKHRVNQEQIYCYCGKSGQFDNNMLQCCKCRNWFHSACIKDFKGPMLRGDGNFVFCCLICSSDGEEFLRRLQINTADFVHLVLYNLSAQRKHQQHKYHHLTKDIWPFVLAQRHTIALPEEWYELSDDALKDRITTTLKINPDRFACGREVKRDCNYYGLRNSGPPTPPKITIEDGDVLSDVFLIKRLRLKLFDRELKHTENYSPTNSKMNVTKSLSTEKDIYEFHSEKEDFDEDEKFTSDDEIPIKHILEKEMRIKKFEAKEQGNDIKLKLLTAPEEKDCKVSHMEDLQKQDGKMVKNNEKRSHKRKAFTLSKPYKEIAAAAAAKRYHSVRNCDSSSDENSSSSRGTSLDLIIPPPKDFLGLNNPFRNVTPKKNSDKKSLQYPRCNPGGPAIKNSIVNTSSLDFSSKLAALKSAGIFPNLNATSLAKAAGQPRMVRTIKRRLSAKDIMIGPNQEVRRRRTRRLSANVEVISTTTINPLPSNIFPLNAKDLFTTGCSNSITNANGNGNASANASASTSALIRKQNILNSLNSNPASLSPPQSSSNSSTSSVLFKEQFSMTSKIEDQSTGSVKLPTHGRRLRTRIQKPVINNSRRSSLSGGSTSSTSSSCTAIPSSVSYPEQTTFNDLQQSVNKYFGTSNRLTEGEKFSVFAKRHLPNGQVQYLIEWGNETDTIVGNADSITNGETESALETNETCSIE